MNERRANKASNEGQTNEWAVRVSSASERTSNPVITSQFLIHLNHSAPLHDSLVVISPSSKVRFSNRLDNVPWDNFELLFDATSCSCIPVRWPREESEIVLPEGSADKKLNSNWTRDQMIQGLRGQISGLRGQISGLSEPEGDKRMDKQKYLCVLQDFIPFWATAQEGVEDIWMNHSLLIPILTLPNCLQVNGWLKEELR